MKAIFNFIYFLQIATLAAAAQRWSEEDRGLESQQIALWSAKISASSAWGVEEKLKEFTLGLESISYRSRMDGHDPEIDKVYKQIQELVTSIPDHTKYFTDKIEEAYESHAEIVRKIEYPPDLATRVQKMIEARGIEFYRDWLRGQWGDYEEISSKNLGILGHIPSTESVLALGHYLRERDEPGIKIECPKTGNLAAESLTGLISDGPMRTWMASWEDVPKWQKWFDEVKAGKRTFRFVGSDVDYTLDGPANAKTQERIRNKTVSIQHSAVKRGHAIVTEAIPRLSAKEPAIRVGVIAALFLCASALALLYKRSLKPQ